MNFKLSNLTREMIASAVHPSNPREKRFDMAIAKSFADQGFSPMVDALTGGKLLAVIAAVVHKSKITHYIVRGAGRIGTLEKCLAGPVHGLSETDREKIVNLVDSGVIEVTLVTDANEKELFAIAADDDALKTSWSIIHRFKAYKQFRRLGYTQEAASRACGLGARSMHFARLEALGHDVEVAWMESKGDAKKPKLTDSDVKEIHDLQQKAKKDNPGLVKLSNEAAQLFATKLAGKPTPKASPMTDKQLEPLAKQCLAARRPDLARLVQIIRGYDPETSVVITNEQRITFIDSLLSPVVETPVRKAANKKR